MRTRLPDGAVLSVVSLLTPVFRPTGWDIVHPLEPALACQELLQQDPFAREHEAFSNAGLEAITRRTMTPEEQIGKMTIAIRQAIKVMGDRFGSTEEDVARTIQALKVSMQTAPHEKIQPVAAAVQA